MSSSARGGEGPNARRGAGATGPHSGRAQSLDDLLEEQGGLVTPTQVRATGLSAYRLRGQRARREWATMYDGRVLLRPGATLTPADRDRAALLALGASAVLAGPSALRRWGHELDFQHPVLRMPASSRREPAGIHVIRASPSADDVRLLGDVLVTGRALSVVDSVLLLPERQADELLDHALQQRWLSFEELVLRTQLMVNRRGVGRLRRLVRVAGHGARSEAERRVIALLRKARVPGWVTQYELAGVGVLDIAFPTLRVAVEVDGRAWHSAADRFQHDRQRQNALVARGWVVLRFTWEDVTRRPQSVLATLRATLELAEAQVPTR